MRWVAVVCLAVGCAAPLQSEIEPSEEKFFGPDTPGLSVQRRGSTRVARLSSDPGTEVWVSLEEDSLQEGAALLVRFVRNLEVVYEFRGVARAPEGTNPDPVPDYELYDADLSQWMIQPLAAPPRIPSSVARRFRPLVDALRAMDEPYVPEPEEGTEGAEHSSGTEAPSTLEKAAKLSCPAFLLTGAGSIVLFGAGGAWVFVWAVFYCVAAATA